jgi:hypothetical protein
MTDDEIRKNREELLRRLPADCRTDAANSHVQSHLDVKRIIPELFTGKPDIESAMYHSFLSGWDAAMNIRSEELLEEHTTLHGIISDYEIEKMRKEKYDV